MKIISANVSKTDEQFEATVSVQSNGFTCVGTAGPCTDATRALHAALAHAISLHTNPLYDSLNVKLTVEF